MILLIFFGWFIGGFYLGKNYEKKKCESLIFNHFNRYAQLMEGIKRNEDYKEGAWDIFDGIWSSCEFDKKVAKCLKRPVQYQLFY